MKGERERKASGGKRIFTEKKRFVVILAVLLLAIAAFFAYNTFFTGEDYVEFQQVKDSEMPVDIAAGVIPEYKTLERALACVAEDDVYVIVTRGEKPTSGFGVDIDRMILEEKKGKMNLIVYAEFDDPDKETAISQIITYPLQVVKTDLQRLPDTIELRIQY